MSNFHEWEQLDHAENWILYEKNIGEFLSIDETSSSQGELYTVLTNKSAKGKKGALVAMIKGTNSEIVRSIIEKIPAFHKSKELKIPNNIALIFLPPYCPELNPAERIWEIMKAEFTGKLFKNLEQLSGFIESQVKQLTQKIIVSTCSYPYIFECLNWTT